MWKQHLHHPLPCEEPHHLVAGGSANKFDFINSQKRQRFKAGFLEVGGFRRTGTIDI